MLLYCRHTRLVHVVESRAPDQIEVSARIHVQEAICRERDDMLGVEVDRRRTSEGRARICEVVLRIELVRERVDPPTKICRYLPADGRPHSEAAGVGRARPASW